LTPPVSPGGTWTADTLYSFGADIEPFGGVVVGIGGVLYGTTSDGGTGACFDEFGMNIGCGTVYSLTPPASPGGAWTYTVLYSFSGASDGDAPFAGLVIGPHGELYGTTSSGGTFGYGTVFALTP
jgi:uncharacterized repeat protein (TIGR03803 family)